MTDQERANIYRFACHCEGISREQLHALQLWSQGAGYKRIGAALGISRDSARGRVDRALATIRRLAAGEAA